MTKEPIDFVEDARARINRLAMHPAYHHVKDVENHLAELSGLSISLIKKFRLGQKTNVTVDSFDRLMKAIRTAEYRSIN